jgi:hypothetical protein
VSVTAALVVVTKIVEPSWVLSIDPVVEKATLPGICIAREAPGN